MSQPSAIVRVSLRADGKLEIVRWDGQALAVPPAQAGAQLVALLRDPSLPSVETSSAGGHELAQQMIDLLVPKEYRPAAAAGAPVLISLAHTWATSRAQRQSEARTNPQAQSEPPGPTPRSAHRRGRRIA